MEITRHSVADITHHNSQKYSKKRYFSKTAQPNGSAIFEKTEERLYTYMTQKHAPLTPRFKLYEIRVRLFAGTLFPHSCVL